ncbi:MAG: GNAT family N-acetyltransferase [Anaerolineales bacterium]
MIPDEKLLARFGKSRNELIRITDAHTLDVQAWLSSRSPQAKTISGKGIRASSTGIKVPILNLALGCNFPEEASLPTINAEIRKLKEFFAERNVPWYWWMNTRPSPSNIGEILKQHGFISDEVPLPAMIAPIPKDINTLPVHPEDIQVWRAETIEDLRYASTIRRRAFKFTEGEALTYFEDMSSDWLDSSSRARLFLAGKSKSEPVSIGAIIYGAGIPGIYVMATLPEHHRQGYGKAIMRKLLWEAKSFEGDFIALTASEAGFGLYSQFGFIHLFGFNFYELP